MPPACCSPPWRSWGPKINADESALWLSELIPAPLEFRYVDKRRLGLASLADAQSLALTTVLSATVLAAGALALTPAPARAEDVITTQEYFSYYHLDTARAKGYTGKGVTIALIDGPVDTSAPELKGANITDKSRCTIEASSKNKGHGVDMASILVSHVSLDGFDEKIMALLVHGHRRADIAPPGV